MFLKKVKLLYISSVLFLLGRSIRLFEAKLAHSAPHSLNVRKTVRLGRKTERLKGKFAKKEAEFFSLLFCIHQSS